MTKSANPLRQYFRQPAIYLRLPTGGKYWTEGSINLPENQELPVLPMTAIDEITYRTPDALFNGQAVVSVIQSCVPAIADAWQAPTIDLNAILVAIRIASYGHGMEITSTCPACTTQEDFELDLRTVLAQMSEPDFTKTVRQGDLEIVFRPITYRHQNEANQKQFEEQRVVQQIPDSNLPDLEKIQRLNEALRKITELTVDALKWSIQSIRTPQAIVNESEHIAEFLSNCDRKLFAAIRDHVIGLRESSELKPVHIKCGSCGHEHDQTLTLDMTNFFAPAS